MTLRIFLPLPDNEQFSILNINGVAKIIGSSFDKDTKNLVSTWTGHLFKAEADRTLYFGLELQQERTEFGILTFSFQDCTAHGWYYSTRIGSKAISGYHAKKVDSFTGLLQFDHCPDFTAMNAPIRDLAITVCTAKEGSFRCISDAVRCK